MPAPKIVVAGFGPFPGVAKNPSARLALAVAKSKRIAASGAKVVGAVIPTIYEEIASILPRLLKAEKPDAVLMFGLAGSTPFMRIETRAANFANRVEPDATGEIPEHPALVADAPKILKVRAPARRLLAAARGAGAKAELSADAGGYICNAAFFRSLDIARRTNAPKLVAFVHIPWPRGQGPRMAAGGVELPSMTLLGRAGEEILLALIAALHRTSLRLSPVGREAPRERKNPRPRVRRRRSRTGTRRRRGRIAARRG